jgi:hypothetical protein
VFLSPHKFIGGPGTPGVLIAKRHLFHNRCPATPGGGTVQYVNPEEHRYLADPEHREEGGTPAIIESIRAGLVFQLKEAVGWETIRAREHDFITRAIASWSQHPNLLILGNKDAWRLSIVSFVVRHQGVPAPQLRRRAVERSVRHPGPRRLLVRRALRPPPARDRPGDVEGVRARDRARLRGHQAGLGAGQLQLLPRPSPRARWPGTSTTRAAWSRRSAQARRRSPSAPTPSAPPTSRRCAGSRCRPRWRPSWPARRRRRSRARRSSADAAAGGRGGRLAKAGHGRQGRARRPKSTAAAMESGGSGDHQARRRSDDEASLWGRVPGGRDRFVDRGARR